jgi:WD40 repeat protein
MARDIEAYLTGAKVGAYAYSSWELIRRFYHKQRATFLVAVVATLSICVLAVVSYRRVVDARDRAVSAEAEQRKSALSARQRLAQLLAESASFALQRRDTASAELLAARALNVEPGLAVRGVIASLSATGQPELSSSHDFARHCVSLAYAAKRRTVVCAAGHDIFKVSAAKLSLVARRSSEVTAVAVTEDARHIFSADRRGVVSAFRDGKHQFDTAPRALAGAVTVLGLAPQEEYLLVGYQSARVEVRRLPDLAIVREFNFDEPATALAMSARGALAVGGRLGALSVWSALDHQQPLRFQGHHGTLTALAFSPDAARLATGSSDQTVRIWRAEDPLQHPTIVRTGHVALGFSWSGDGQHLVYGTREHRVHWIDVRLNRTLSELPGHQQQVPLVALSADGRELASVDSQLGVRRWRVPDQRFRERLVEPGNVLVLAAGLGPTRLVGAGLGSNGICLWNLTNTQCDARLPFRSEQVRALALTSDGGRLAAGGKRGELMVWDVESMLPVTPLFGHTSDVRALTFLKGGARLISGDLAGKLVLWEVSSAKRHLERTLPAGVSAISLSPDGEQVAVALRNRTIELWDSRLEKRLTRLAGHSDWVMDVVYANEDQLISAGADSSVLVWDVGRRAVTQKFQVGEGRVLSVDVSRDGRWLVAGGEDACVRVFDLEQMRLLMTLRDHDAAIRSVRFVGEGMRFASASDDRSIRLWDLEQVLNSSPEALLTAAEARYGVDADAVVLTK